MLPGAPGRATRSKEALIAPGLTTSNKELLVTKGIATRSKEATRASTRPSEMELSDGATGAPRNGAPQVYDDV